MTGRYYERLRDRAVGFWSIAPSVLRSRRHRSRDRDAVEGLAPEFGRALTGRPLRIVQRVVLVCVTVGPAVHVDRQNIACRVKPG